MLPGLPQFFPAANPLNVLPQVSFNGGVPSLNNNSIASIGVESRFPFFGYNTLWNISGNVSKLKSSHTIKTGLFVEHTTWPSNFACPNLVLRGEDGLNYGVSDVMSPWSAAVAEPGQEA